MVTAVTSQAWQVAGIGDFDGDGHDDVFWRNASTGANTIWRSANSGSRIPVATVAGASWQVAAIGDFDDDGNDDVFWRNASTGANRLWRSANASTRIGVVDVTNTAWWEAFGDPDLSALIQGALDANKDLRIATF